MNTPCDKNGCFAIVLRVKKNIVGIRQLQSYKDFKNCLKIICFQSGVKLLSHIQWFKTKIIVGDRWF